MSGNGLDSQGDTTSLLLPLPALEVPRLLPATFHGGGAANRVRRAAAMLRSRDLSHTRQPVSRKLVEPGIRWLLLRVNPADGGAHA
jgi:hypothetical protein